MQTCGTVLSYCPHITPGQRELRHGIGTAPATCPGYHREAVCAQTASRSPDSTFWGRAGCFCAVLAPGDQSASAYSVASAQDAPLVSS
eukprot:scaffold18239_cov112-Isochrysis_galbana.AAC.7